MHHAPLTPRQRFLLSAYGAAHYLAAPLLSMSKRLRAGLFRRFVPEDWGRSTGTPWQDVWIQAASGGESYLAWELIKEFSRSQRFSRVEGRLSVLATACTDEGIEVLDQALAWCRQEETLVACGRDYFPFDVPRLMRRALLTTLPKVVVLLETELWPGLLAACAREQVPVAVINGRMRTKSLARYLLMADFFRRTAPATILAVSEPDARRFAALFGPERVGVMHNIKFDRCQVQEAPPFVNNPLAQVLRPGVSFAVFGSFRQDEESEVLDAAARLHAARPKTTIGLFPKHLARVPALHEKLTAAGLVPVLRSTLFEPAPPGTVILWDIFGELNAAYGLARATFVGGGLKPLGGQNFLEPLAQGIIPCIGPHFGNFAWAGTDLVAQGLARVVHNTEELADEMLRYLQRPPTQTRVKERFAAFLAERRGGVKQACEAVARLLE